MIFRNEPWLIEAFRRGRRDALEAVYRHYVCNVERYLLALARTNGPGEMAQAAAISDLLQEVFTRAFAEGQRQAYDGLRPYGPYLLGIARNCFLDMRRAAAREVLKTPQDVGQDLDIIESPPIAWSEPRIAEILGSFLAAAPAAVRAVCEQRFVLGRSQEEVASSLGLSRKEVRTAEDSLRRGLRKALARAGVSLGETRLLLESGDVMRVGSPMSSRGR